MKFFDMHCDTLMLGFMKQKDDMYEMPGMLDIKRMKEAGQLAQFFAIFMPPAGAEKMMELNAPLDDKAYIDYCFTLFENTMQKHTDMIAPAYNVADVLANEKAGKMSGLLTFEDGRPIDGKLENLQLYYDKGIRLIGLTWNGENCFGFPNSTDPAVMQKGLKDWGKEAILKMNDLGMIIDVSHLSDGGFYDVAEISKKPFVASHSNCRALSPHQRNLTDDMIKVLANKGGVAGINFAPAFLDPDITAENSTVELLCKHIHHMVNLGGIDFPALGSDFDGIGGNLEVGEPTQMHLIFDRLQKDGLSEDAIEKIAYKNVIRVLKDTL